jgi:hypothetical protein
VPLLTERAFEDLYRHALGPLWTYVHRVIGNAADADEVVQEAFCRVLCADVSALSLEQQRRYVFRVAVTSLSIGGDTQGASACGFCASRKKELSCRKRPPMTLSESSRC